MPPTAAPLTPLSANGHKKNPSMSYISGSPARTSAATQAEVERVAHELHTLYKAKHETKVAALKKSYAARWQKTVDNLEDQVETLSKQNEELRRELEERRELDEKRDEELQEDTSFSTPSNDDDLRFDVRELQTLLENERLEKEGIINLVEELLSIQASAPADEVEEQMRGTVRRASGAHAFRGGASRLQNGTGRMGMGAPSARREPASRTD